MLAGILSILKVAGLVLLGLIGLILLLILLVLLVPIRYEVNGSLKEKKPEGRAAASWLLHILSVRMVYEKKFELAIRVFGIRVGPGKGKKSGRKAGKKEEKSPSGLQEAEDAGSELVAQQAVPDETVSLEHAALDGKGDAGASEGEAGTARGDAAAPEDEAGTARGDAAAPEDGAGTRAKEDDGYGKPAFSFSRICDKLKAAVEGIRGKREKIIQGIRGKLDRIREKVTKLKEKKETIQEFLQDRKNLQMLRLAVRQVFRLIRHILPRKMKGWFRFGFDDPYTTGQILTYVSPFYGLYADRVKLIPDFGESVLEGELRLKGKIRIGTALIIAARMLLNKNFRKLLKKLLRA